MGLWQLAGIHISSGFSQHITIRISGSHAVLGHPVPRRIRMERKRQRPKTVQFPSGSDGGRLHHIQRILRSIVQDMPMLSENIREASPHSLSRFGNSMCSSWFLGRLGFAQSRRTPHNKLLFPSQLDRPCNYGPVRHTEIS
ncbi:hypothetical protein BDFB_006678 [Asbolus verrucosus]|uniref:Uncharacterized protein n=1 Tax=Asbolus verrucosus TaxID=1661398 RepID=A0A482W7Q9_ASBVE|nr:hypothetical protein BDFB_006678 [Asbolus verrucosus]